MEVIDPTSQAIVIDYKSHASLKTVPQPEVRFNDLLVRIEACGVCKTDISLIDREFSDAETKIPGHEGVGLVVQVGKGTTGFNVGDRVGIPWLAKTCGSCELCLKGQENLCETQLNSGLNSDGCFASHVRIDFRFAVKIPDSLTAIQAAPILCAGVTAYTAIKKSGARAGDYICILGAAGGIGHLAVQYAKCMGLSVIAIENNSNKIEFMRDLGADIAVDASKFTEEQFVAELLARTNGAGCAASINAAPSAAAMSLSLRVLKNGGTAVLIALNPQEIVLPLRDIIFRGLKIVGSIVGSRLDMMEAMNLASRGCVLARSHVCGMESYENVLSDFRKNSYEGRVVFACPPFSIN